MVKAVTNLPRARKSATFAAIRRAQLAIENMFNRTSDDCDGELMEYGLDVSSEALRDAKICTAEDACAAVKMFVDNPSWMDSHPEVLRRAHRWMQRHLASAAA